MRAYAKRDFPVANSRRLLEPGPVVLVSSAWRGARNIMTMGWHTVMEFEPSLVGCIIAEGNHSHGMIKRSRECVINVPTVDLAKQVVGIGNCSGAEVDKFAAFKLTLNASFGRMIPRGHPYIQSYLEHQKDLRGLGNSLRVVVESTSGDIYDPGYLEALRKVSDELALMPGVDRAWVKSLWTPAVRWTEVTEEGFRGGPVMPDNYDGSPAATEQLRANIARSGIVGSLVGTNYKSSMIFVPLLDRDPASGKAIDYRSLSRTLEQTVRAKYEGQNAAVRIHVIGFAKLVGELIEGLAQVMLYFAAAALVAVAIIFF